MNSKVIPNEQFFTIVESIIKSGQTLEMNIKGSSMYPTLISGKHKIVLAPMRKEYLHKGIIALFLYNGKHVLHRLVAIDGDLLTFQGDNLPYSKEVAKQTDIIAFA